MIDKKTWQVKCFQLIAGKSNSNIKHDHEISCVSNNLLTFFHKYRFLIQLVTLLTLYSVTDCEYPDQCAFNKMAARRKLRSMICFKFGVCNHVPKDKEMCSRI